ncbi:hypothetical protein CDAR_583331 [Caerostris darwini]|uniref:LAGLIDADG homing endonuclease n=1 Tax=Caerostris darwini TaxID=1538125 RepID=A0AAV4V9J1_9ARAC|nr:hypothetical protein CDAR_583331 [Caerostris darwini]
MGNERWTMDNFLTKDGQCCRTLCGLLHNSEYAINLCSTGDYSKFINTIKAVSSVLPSKNRSDLECQLLIDFLTDGGQKVTLKWIPSRCGVAGHEFADTLAKAGSNLPQSDSSVCYHDIKIIIIARVKVHHRETIFYSVKLFADTFPEILKKGKSKGLLRQKIGGCVYSIC